MAQPLLEHKRVVPVSEALRRRKLFLLCRYVVIFATAGLAFAELGPQVSIVPCAMLILLAVASNIVLSNTSPYNFFDATFQAPILVADTAMISFALLLSRASQESFLFFFFVLIMAAQVENLVLLGVGAVAIGFASFLLAGSDAGWASPALMRIPFILAAGLFYGYVVLPERSGQMVPFGRTINVPPRGSNSVPGAGGVHELPL